jgi:drug/metabolite transporter (DMT)-like permease
LRQWHATVEQPSRFVAVAEGLIVNLIWSSSFVFVKMGLDYVGPLTMAGLRYFLAFVLLLPLMLGRRNPIRPLPPQLWIRLLLIGLSAYTLGNGALYWGLKYLSATTGSFLMSFVPLFVLFVGIFWLKEMPTQWQIAGTAISLGGGWLFFSPGFSAGEPLGIGIVVVGLLGFVIFGILGREVARGRQVDTLSLTAIPLAFGGGLLLLIAFPIEGLPQVSMTGWSIVLWLAVVNTALAYMVYNHSLQMLTALEMNVLLNLSPLGTAALAWLLLGERFSSIQIVGMLTVIGGVILVQGGARSGTMGEGEKKPI